MLVFGTLDKPRELKFQLWLRLSEKYGGGVVVVVFSDYNAYPNLDFDFDLDQGVAKTVLINN